MDPFRAHLVALLSIYELGPFPGTPIPRYEGPTDWQTEFILKSFDAVARRMCSAEEIVSDLRKQLVIVCHFFDTQNYVYTKTHSSRTVKQLLSRRPPNKVLKRSLLLKKKVHRLHGSMRRIQSLSMVCSRPLILPLYSLVLTGMWKLIRFKLQQQYQQQFRP